MAFSDMTEKEKKAYAKVFDEKDELFSGTVTLNILDEDGYVRKIKGSQTDAVVHCEKAPEGVKLISCFNPTNPLFYLEIKGEQSHYLFGQVFCGLSKGSKLMEIGRIVPKKMSELNDEMEKNNGKGSAQLEMPFVKDLAKKLANIEVTSLEKKFKRTISGLVIGIPADAWKEIKEYRIRSYLQDKTWEGLKKAGDEEKKEDSEKTETKEES